MRNIIVKVHPSKSKLKKEDQLAWKIAEIASDKAKINKDAVEMVINRIIDNAGRYSFLQSKICNFSDADVDITS